MEDFNMNSTSLNESYNHSDICPDCSDNGNLFLWSSMPVVTYVISGIGLTLILVAIYALYSQIQKDHVAPIYLINLLISDLIQFCCMIGEVATSYQEDTQRLIFAIHIYSLFASVGFMVCIALERYLVITCPLWYRFRRTIKASVVVCVLVWTLPLVIFSIGCVALFFMEDNQNPLITFGIFLLLPLPLFIFFLVGTLKALSAAISVTSDEKRRIVGILVLVLLIYTLLFMPTIILFLQEKLQDNFTLNLISIICTLLSPLADLLLYVFMRKGMIDKLLTSVCCCKMDSNDTTMSSV